MVARNSKTRKRSRRKKRAPPKDSPLQERSRFKYPTGSGGMQARLSLVLGVPGGARAAHVMQFRPVGVERPGQELAPEGTDFSEWAGAVAAASRGGEGF
jgi:hypothetical protein